MALGGSCSSALRPLSPWQAFGFCIAPLSFVELSKLLWNYRAFFNTIRNDNRFIFSNDVSNLWIRYTTLFCTDKIWLCPTIYFLGRPSVQSRAFISLQFSFLHFCLLCTSPFSYFFLSLTSGEKITNDLFFTSLDFHVTFLTWTTLCTYILDCVDWANCSNTTKIKWRLKIVFCSNVNLPGRLDWTGLDWTGLDWTGLDRTGPDWTGLDRTGPDWTGLDRTGLDWTNFSHRPLEPKPVTPRLPAPPRRYRCR